MDTPAVSVHNLVISFSRWGQRVTALDHMSIEVNRGEWILLVGHNGAGKSTLFKAITGELRPDAGDVKILGRKIQTLTPRQIAPLVFEVHQDPLFGTAPLLTAFENLLVADPRKHASSADRQKHYISLLEPLGLAERINQPVKVLSGGERQLLALVISRLRNTPIVLLDEPMAALDPLKVKLCVEEISAIHREGKTVVQIAHDTQHLRSLVDRIVRIDHGRVAEISEQPFRT